jgi:4-hydroxyphenylpyruvate dioxygenase
VELYRHGQVNLVLNSEPDSAAASHFEMHGPSVCAMGLAVDDAAAAARRAEALLCASWNEKRGVSERLLPALRAPNGALVLLVENQPGRPTLWDDDFHLLPAAPPAGPPLLGIDHVTQALAPGQMDGFVLFYRGVFGLEPEPQLDLPDPQGLVHSRAMVNAGGTVRLPLNTSEARETATGRFISAAAGAGVHHIAFLVEDAAATATALAAGGAPLLPIPGNYYDDLSARFALEDAELDALRRLNLLYDQDAEGGSFRHAYTTSFANRFFFEVVQRRGGYRQFGANNAAVRMAAQARFEAGRRG